MEIILKYFKGLTDRQIMQYQKLGEIYLRWNEKINVISRKDIDHLYLRHVLHSLAIARFIHFIPGTEILDLGTGGGFPGIPLAIYFPEVKFILVDSIAKKIKVVREVCKEVGLQNIDAFQLRTEKVEETFDFIVTRAVAPLPLILKWTNKKIKPENQNRIPNGILALKGGDLTKETAISFEYKIIDISQYFEESFFATKKLVHVII